MVPSSFSQEFAFLKVEHYVKNKCASPKKTFFDVVEPDPLGPKADIRTLS